MFSCSQYKKGICTLQGNPAMSVVLYMNLLLIMILITFFVCIFIDINCKGILLSKWKLIGSGGLRGLQNRWACRSVGRFDSSLFRMMMQVPLIFAQLRQYVTNGLLSCCMEKRKRKKHDINRT